MNLSLEKELNKITRDLHSLQISSIATNRAIITVLQKYLPQAAMSCAQDLERAFKEHYAIITGINPDTRISTGHIVITRYTRGGKIKKWVLGEHNASIQDSTQS